MELLQCALNVSSWIFSIEERVGILIKDYPFFIFLFILLVLNLLIIVADFLLIHFSMTREYKSCVLRRIKIFLSRSSFILRQGGKQTFYLFFFSLVPGFQKVGVYVLYSRIGNLSFSEIAFFFFGGISRISCYYFFSSHVLWGIIFCVLILNIFRLIKKISRSR